MFSYSTFTHNAISEEDRRYKRPLSALCRVFVGGTEVPVYTCRISKYPFNTVWPGHQRPFDQSEEASFVNLVSDEALNIEILTDTPYDRLLIKPYSKEIRHTEEDGRIRFTLTENGGYVVEFGDYHKTLYIFNSKPISAPRADEVTHFFGAGIHFPGKIKLNSNESVYIDKDALVYGCIYACGAENIHIFGNGILDDSHEERSIEHCYEDFTNGNMKFYECKNLRIEGVGMTNSAIWCMNLFACFDVVLDGIKIFGQWRYNTDGIDIVNCQDIAIQNSFIHSFDDTVTIKGIDRFAHIDNKNIRIENCVLWCDWGKCCEVGVETVCREYANISFRHCDVLRPGYAALDINNGDLAEIHDVTFEDIRVEYNRFDTDFVYQSKDDECYSAQNSLASPCLVLICNYAWRTEKVRSDWGLPTLDTTFAPEKGKVRSIHDVTVKNIRVYYDEGLPLSNGMPNIKIELHHSNDTAEYADIRIEDITANGQKIR